MISLIVLSPRKMFLLFSQTLKVKFANKVWQCCNPFSQNCSDWLETVLNDFELTSSHPGLFFFHQFKIFQRQEKPSSSTKITTK